MLLAIDIGNTMTDFGRFEGGELAHFHRTHSRADLSVEEACLALSKGEGTITDVVLSSVVPALTKTYIDACIACFGIEPRVVKPEADGGLTIRTDNPAEVGADLLAAALGAKAIYDHSVIIADLGTASKVLLLDKDGAFAGCTIGTGIGLQSKSLSGGAALLPEVSPQIPNKILGKNTADCMNSALTYGNAFSIRALAEGIEKEAGYPCKRILTGGYANVVKDLLPEFEYQPHLVLCGLSQIQK